MGQFEMKLLPSPSFQTVLLDYSRRLREHASEHMYLVLSTSLFFTLYAIASFTVFPKVIKLVASGNISTEKYRPTNNSIVTTTIPSPTITPSPTKEPSRVPVELSIPKLNIKASVEHVGQTKKLNMDVPKNASNVAWYVYGAKPGEMGNAVISGHYDTPTGAPAVFFQLRELVVGDEITITSEDGTVQTFIVNAKERHPYDKFPNELVFHTRPGKNVNLITCDGIWDQKNAIYNDRLVLFTSLKES